MNQDDETITFNMNTLVDAAERAVVELEGLTKSEAFGTVALLIAALAGEHHEAYVTALAEAVPQFAEKLGSKPAVLS